MGGLTTALVRIDADAEQLVKPLRQLRAQVLASLVSAHSQRNYALALDEFIALWKMRAVSLSRALLLEYRAQLLERGLASSTINVRLSAVRKLVAEARGNGLIDAELAAAVDGVENVAQRGQRIGNWLTRAQAKELLRLPDRATLKGRRDYVILSFLVGCALRRSELAALKVGDIQLRDGRWVIVDLVGKGRRLRSEAMHPESLGARRGRSRRIRQSSVEEFHAVVREKNDKQSRVSIAERLILFAATIITAAIIFLLGASDKWLAAIFCTVPTFAGSRICCTCGSLAIRRQILGGERCCRAAACQ
jgi:integrase